MTHNEQAPPVVDRPDATDREFVERGVRMRTVLGMAVEQAVQCEAKLRETHDEVRGFTANTAPGEAMATRTLSHNLGIQVLEASGSAVVFAGTHDERVLASAGLSLGQAEHVVAPKTMDLPGGRQLRQVALWQRRPEAEAAPTGHPPELLEAVAAEAGDDSGAPDGGVVTDTHLGGPDTDISFQPVGPRSPEE